MINESVSHYKIVQQLGEGGMGVVYKAMDTRLDRPVALKFLSDELAKDPQALERFRKEARAASALNHPHICTIYDIGEFRGKPFIVMEYLEGHSLKERIAQGPLPMDELLDAGVQIAGAMEAAHAHGIVHRDIKPANIFLTGQGQIKILDFGLAKVAPKETGTSTTAGAALMTTAGTAVGTIAYMSPEQARAEEVDTRSDLFSIGVVLYEMATGRQAFPGTSVAMVYDSILNRDPVSAVGFNAEMPGDLDYTIRKSLEKDRRFRYQHCSELKADLERLRRNWISGRSQAIHVRPLQTSVQIPVQVSAQAHIPAPGPEARRRAKRAFILGFIPGVGALYNEDYKRALIHFAVFGALSSLSGWVTGPLHEFFRYLLLGFYLYMPFQAYHSAKSGAGKL